MRTAKAIRQEFIPGVEQINHNEKTELNVENVAEAFFPKMNTQRGGRAGKKSEAW